MREPPSWRIVDHQGSVVDELRLGVIARTAKENERRLPIHPRHVERIDADLRARIVLEEGYGANFGVPDQELVDLVAGLRPRSELIAASDVVLLPKPLAPDLAELRPGQVLWGWPHCVQDHELTQVAVDRRLTLIAWEAMNHWHADGSYNLHVFHQNNELAGYCSVLHAMQLIGATGHYGRRPLRAAVIGFGATARGAIGALNGLGIQDIDVLTSRDVHAVADPIHFVRILHHEHPADEPHGSMVTLEDGDTVSPADFLAEHDIIVNCVLQDPKNPVLFLVDADLADFERGSLIVDVSCDEGMGFSWARPTSFEDPMFTVGDGVHYYAVDHSPSHLYDAATWEISDALLPHLRTVLDGPAAWAADETIRRAIEIRDGVILNPDVLAFQQRHDEYPHPYAHG
jgi:alanine dehydrogenase